MTGASHRDSALLVLFPSGLVGKSPTNFRSDVRQCNYMLIKPVQASYLYDFLVLTVAAEGDPQRPCTSGINQSSQLPTGPGSLPCSPHSLAADVKPCYNLYRCQIESVAMSTAARTLGMTVIRNT